MYAVTFPNVPLFAEHFNPDLKLKELHTCPESGQTYEQVLSFRSYFYGMRKADRQEILEAFDKHGYYETYEDAIADGRTRMLRYTVTLYPLTNNG